MKKTIFGNNENNNDEEYLACPNCDCNLEEQFGFTEDMNVYVCENCGAELLNPDSDDEYVWHCNKCNDILNNQDDWKYKNIYDYCCTNCGAHQDLTNPYSEEYWEDDEDDYEDEDEEYLACPNCNCNLEEQFGFTEDMNVYVCENCGAELLNPDSDDEYVWHCNKCNDILNNQDDWKYKNIYDYCCTNCGAHQDLTDPYSEEYWEDDEDDNDIDEDGEDEAYEEVYCPNCNYIFINHQEMETNQFFVCPRCNIKLYNPHIYSGERFKDVYWYCDGCNSLLNSQRNFNDRRGIWFCSECGYKNIIEANKIDSYNEENLDNNVNENEIIEVNPQSERKKSNKKGLKVAAGVTAGIAFVAGLFSAIKKK